MFTLSFSTCPVSERAIITDDSQEASVRDSEPAEFEKSAGSSDKISESIHTSGSSYTNSIPSAASPDKRKRKRTNDEEDSGASKLSELASEDFSPVEPANFDPFASAAAISSYVYFDLFLTILTQIIFFVVLKHVVYG
jgi:hypothetical protein